MRYRKNWTVFYWFWSVENTQIKKVAFELWNESFNIYFCYFLVCIKNLCSKLTIFGIITMVYITPNLQLYCNIHMKRNTFLCHETMNRLPATSASDQNADRTWFFQRQKLNCTSIRSLQNGAWVISFWKYIVTKPMLVLSDM